MDKDFGLFGVFLLVSGVILLVPSFLLNRYWISLFGVFLSLIGLIVLAYVIGGSEPPLYMSEDDEI